MRLLADSDYLVALFRKNDIHHHRALKIAQKYSQDPIFVTSFTIPETATVLSYKENQKLARDFLLYSREQPFTELKYTEESSAISDDIFLKQAKRGTSWFDCFNVAVIKLHNLDGILSFDGFYKKQEIKNFCKI